MRRVTLFLVTLVALFIATPSQALIVRDIGTGTDTSYLYIQFADQPENSVLFRYSYDYSESTPVTGSQLIFDIANTAGSLFSSSGNGGSTDLGGFYFAYEFTYNGYSEYGDFTTPKSWNYYTAGGLDVVYDPETFTPVWGPGGVGDYTLTAVAEGAWASSMVGSSGRVITPGSWDGWTYGSYPGPVPDVAPVPEPSTYLLIFSGAILLIVARRFRRASA